MCLADVGVKVPRMNLAEYVYGSRIKVAVRVFSQRKRMVALPKNERMHYLVYDVSGHKKITDWKRPFTDTLSWPRVVHISWILLDEAFKPVEDFNAYTRHPDFKMTETMIRDARIEVEEFEPNASPIADVMALFAKVIEKADRILSFNQQYNENIAAAEFLRQKVKHNMFKKDNICLMRESTYFCQLPGPGGKFKWPSLNELHAILFQQQYGPQGNARADVVAAARCFIKLMKLGELEDLFE